MPYQPCAKRSSEGGWCPRRRGVSFCLCRATAGHDGFVDTPSLADVTAGKHVCVWCGNTFISVQSRTDAAPLPSVQE